MDYPDLEEARKQLIELRQLLADYISSDGEVGPFGGLEDQRVPPIEGWLPRDPGDGPSGIAHVHLTLHATLIAVDRCLATLDAVQAAGGFAQYIIAHLPRPPAG